MPVKPWRSPSDALPMARPLTRSELDACVQGIVDNTVRRLEAVPWEGRYGDWEALIRKHREMTAILVGDRARLGALVPPPECAAAFRDYLAAYDVQLEHEWGIVAAAETRVMDLYRGACRALLPAHAAREAAGRRTGLKSTYTSRRQSWRIRLTLPLYIAGAIRHGRAEERAGRRWD